jgi:proteasome accessory factor C
VADLNMMLVSGLPGYGPGELMDAYIDGDEVIIDMAEYFAMPLRLTAAEALMVLAGGMAVLSSGAAPEALATAVEKLQAAIFPDPGVLTVDLASEPDAIGVLRSAVGSGTVVRIRYAAISSGAVSDREIEPHAVFSTLGNWYVTGHCRQAGDRRTFRIDRIQEAATTDESFAKPAEVPDPEVRYVPGPDDVVARIELSPAARWVAEYYPVDVVEGSGDSLTVDFSSSDPAVAARLLVRLGADAELVAGDTVRDATADLRHRILGRYGD